MKKFRNDYYGMANGDIHSALILAIEFKDLEAVQALIPLQTDINKLDDSELSWTPLMYAVFEGSLEIVQKLIEAGADVNIRGSDPDDFALSLAVDCCQIFPPNHDYIRNKKIFDYLYPLTSPQLQAIAKQALNSKE